MRITTDEYRTWDLQRWITHARELGVSSISEWARVSEYTYRVALVLGVHRKVAAALGWRCKIENGGIQRMSDEEFAARFRALGVRTITDMWRSQQPWCQFLRQEGRLQRVAALLGIEYVNKFHPADLSYYVDRCRAAGYFDAWCQLDRNAVWAARKHGLLDEVRQRCPRRPDDGFITRGGRCTSLPELAVARLLEYNRIPFVTEPEYPFHLSARRYHLCRADFLLTLHDVWVEVWSTPLEAKQIHWLRYPEKRRAKVQRCYEFGLRLVEIEGRLLFTRRVPGYLAYLRETFRAAGIPIRVIPEPRQALALEGPRDMAGNGAGTIQ